jgi:ribonuclease R
MTYTRVREIVEGRDQGEGLPPGAVGRFLKMAELAAQMRKLREAEGSIDFDLPEPQIELDLRGRITDIFRSERTVAHRLIEEFMLAANRVVAGRLADLERPVLYRVHEEPDSEKVLLFRRFAEGLGYVVPKGKISPLTLSKLMRKVEGKPEAPVLNNLLLRSLPQARYSEENLGHFGLAFERYAHFTSPIRRYPDLVVHRVLAAMLGDMAGGGVSYKREELHVLGGHCSDRERAAVDAEREIVQIKKIRFLAERVGEEYDGFVVGVASFGVFVELTDHMVDGLVHVSSLEDDYYQFDEETQTLRGEHGGRVFRIGDKLRVRIESASLERRRVDFRLVGADAPKPRGGGRPVKRQAPGGKGGTMRPGARRKKRGAR